MVTHQNGFEPAHVLPNIHIDILIGDGVPRIHASTKSDHPECEFQSLNVSKLRLNKYLDKIVYILCH